MRNRPEVTRAAEIDHYGQRCYLLAEVTRERGQFSVIGSIYSSRRAFEIGSDEAIIVCGQVVDEIRAAFPELRPIQDVHLCDVRTGEPLHAVANARYHLEHHDVPAAARSLGRTVTDLDRAGVVRMTTDDDVAMLAEYVEQLRPEWAEAARAANEWIEANLGGPEPGDADDPEEDYYVDLGESTDLDSLRIHARLSGTGTRHGVGRFYEYTVSVCDHDYTYETTYGGSVADYQDGRICAREAAFGVLRELCDFADYEDAADLAVEMGMVAEVYTDPERRERWEATHFAAVEFSDHLDHHGDLVGR